MPGIALACPRCHRPLDSLAEDVLYCPKDDLRFACVDGVWHFILPERAAHFAQFMQEYQTVREREARGSTESAYYRALPFHDLTGRFSADWRIRAASFQTVLNRVVEPLEQCLTQPLRILDIGAGNGWLSNRLASRGHALAAVDLQINDADGLGAYRHYETTFLRLQAEFEHLPCADGTADLLIYNASFHYAENYDAALTEAERVLTPAGQVVIIDTPIYCQANTGQQMVREREEDFVRRFGFRSNALHSENFLIDARLAELGQRLQIRWQSFTPNYGWRWRLRPWLARLRGKRPPARFTVLVGRRN